MEAIASPVKIRYLRIPPWVRLEYRCFHAGDSFFDVHLKAREHRAKLSCLSIRGILFESDSYVPDSTYITVVIKLSDDHAPFQFDCRIVRSRKAGDGRGYMTKAEFVARTEEEINSISHFVKKYY